MGEMMEEQEYDEINLMDYVRVIWRRKLLIVVIIFVAVVATAIISLTMKPVYEAKAMIMPVGGQSKDMGSAAVLAAQFGIAPSASPAASEIVSLLKTNILRERVISRHGLLPILLDKNQGCEKAKGDIVWAGIRALQGIVKINYLQKDNIIEVSAQFTDPKWAAYLVNITLFELNDLMSSEAKRVADTNKKYLEAQLDRTADPFIKTKIYNLIAQQIENSTMAEVKENFAFKVLDPPRAPDRPIKPQKRQMAMIAFVVALFLGIFTAFVVEYVKRAKGGR